MPVMSVTLVTMVTFRGVRFLFSGRGKLRVNLEESFIRAEQLSILQSKEGLQDCLPFCLLVINFLIIFCHFCLQFFLSPIPAGLNFMIIFCQFCLPNPDDQIFSDIFCHFPPKACWSSIS